MLVAVLCSAACSGAAKPATSSSPTTSASPSTLTESSVTALCAVTDLRVEIGAQDFATAMAAAPLIIANTSALACSVPQFVAVTLVDPDGVAPSVDAAPILPIATNSVAPVGAAIDPGGSVTTNLTYIHRGGPTGDTEGPIYRSAVISLNGETEQVTIDCGGLTVYGDLAENPIESNGQPPASSAAAYSPSC
ncbi:MAG: hypothetical protein QOE63_1147 [Acidimicrobiaceae bacterium]